MVEAMPVGNGDAACRHDASDDGSSDHDVDDGASDQQGGNEKLLWNNEYDSHNALLLRRRELITASPRPLLLNWSELKQHQ